MLNRLRALGAELSGRARSREFWRVSRKGFPLVLPMPGPPGSLRLDYASDFLYILATDTARNAAFERAIARAGARQVLEVGCGPWLPLTKLALAHGAEEVVAIEAAPGHAEAARHRADAQRVTVLAGKASDVTLPPGFKPDLVIGELLGYLASEEGAPAIFADLQRRIGPVRVIPRAARSLVAPVRPLALTWRQRWCNWRAHGVWPALVPGHLYDCRNFPLGAELAEPQAWEEFDFESAAPPERLEQTSELEFAITPGEEVGGLLFWMHAQLDEDTVIDTRDSATHWNQYYLHLPPTRLGLEGKLAVRTSVDARSEDVTYRFHVGGVASYPSE